MFLFPAVVETIGRPRLGVSVERGITVTATRELGDLMCGAEHRSRQCALPLPVCEFTGRGIG